MSDTVPPAANETLASAEDFLVQLRSAALNRRTCLARAFGGLRPLCALCDVAACGLKLEVTEEQWRFFLLHKAVDPLIGRFAQRATEVELLVTKLGGLVQEHSALDEELSRKTAEFDARKTDPWTLPSDTGRDDSAAAMLRADIARDQRAHVRALKGENLDEAFLAVLHDDFEVEQRRRRIGEKIALCVSEWLNRHAETHTSLLGGHWRGVRVHDVFGLLEHEMSVALHRECVDQASPLHALLSEFGAVTRDAYADKSRIESRLLPAEWKQEGDLDPCPAGNQPHVSLSNIEACEGGNASPEAQRVRYNRDLAHLRKEHRRAETVWEESAVRISEFVSSHGAELCFLDAMSNVYYEMVACWDARCTHAQITPETVIGAAKAMLDSNHRGKNGVREGKARFDALCSSAFAPTNAYVCPERAEGRYTNNLENVPSRWRLRVPCSALPSLQLAVLHVVRV